MKRKLLLGFLGLFLVLCCTAGAWSDESNGPYTIMKPDRETRLRWLHNYETAPGAYIDKSVNFSIMPGGSLSLLSHLQYTPSERNQGSCGNCWAWAGTGAMGIAMDVQENILDRLSVQFISSCNMAKSCCEGGWLNDLTDFYAEGYTIPWSNTNANWQNGDGNCNVDCSSIATWPNYAIDSIAAETIETHNVGQTQAIANIKNVLSQNKAVWFGFFLANKADWDTFRNFFNAQAETVTINLDYGCDHTWVDGDGGGHAVLCVGYNDDDPENSYWIMLNSWGTAGGVRPNGTFRLDMDMDYDCKYNDDGLFWSYYWQTLDVSFNIDEDVLYVESSGYCNGNKPCYSTIQGAVNAAGSGTTIKIAGGSYGEDVSLNTNNSTLQGSWDSSLFTTTLMPPSAVEAENVIEKMTIIRLQREKDIEEAHSPRLGAPEASQQTGNCVIINTITAPDNDTCGLAWDKGYLWASEGGLATTYPGVIFKIDTAGNILFSFDAPGQSSIGPRPEGLAFDGTYLWSVDYLDDKIYALSKSGHVIGSIPAPSGISSGLAWDGTNLWVSEWFSCKIYKLNPENGQILMSFNAPDYEYPYGLAWDGAHLWVSNSNGIYMLDPITGTVLASCNDSAFKYGKVYGMTWDGQYLWGGSWISNSIIKINVPTLNTSKNLTLSGGWDATFTTQSSETIFETMTISDGCAVVDKLILGSTAPGPTEPNISYSGSDPYDYGTVQVETFSDHDFTIQNTGSVTLNISGAFASGTGFSVTGSVPSSISAGGSDTITVRFAPGSVGSHTGTLSINSDDPGTPTLNIGLNDTKKAGRQSGLSWLR